ncbi:MAG: CTP synthase (glutamine hydrolyzing) [Candidatus Nanoarchaeia archaeon]|nr:CTP synthase (glutamine hydrolyzing) [Candidatus Nanoarchaeia archaeon]
MHEDVISLGKKGVEEEGYSEIPENYKKGKSKYIVIIGTVMSGIGKGIFSSSLGTLLGCNGIKVVPMKFDGYLNYDAGTLNPYRHGEVFVLDDGTETDLDLGSYERFNNRNLTKENYLTAGKLFKTIIDKERAGKYLGRDVQFIPHVTGEIKHFVRNLANKSDADVVIIEVGGTVGDLENSYFIEAMRQLAYEEGKDNVCFVSLSYILKPSSLGEHKSKAAQIGLRNLLSLGVQPDIIICRSNLPIETKIREKISVYSNLPVEKIFNLHNVNGVYEIPLYLREIGLDKTIMERLSLQKGTANSELTFENWERFADNIKKAEKTITIGITGKYTELWDSYISILNALEHCAPYYGCKVNIKWIDTTEISEENVNEKLRELDGIVVPGGFGSRGVEGKIRCVRYAREKRLPYLGLCYGFQMAIIEFARNVLGWSDAHTTEVDRNTSKPVIDLLFNQKSLNEMGGTMRLGGKEIILRPGSFVSNLYGKTQIRERFRHRYEFNNNYFRDFIAKGMVFSGKAKDEDIIQVLELREHPFFVGVQFHPEYTSKPLRPSPLYLGFVYACLKRKI